MLTKVTSPLRCALRVVQPVITHQAKLHDSRILLTELSESQLTDIELEGLCQQLIEKSSIRADRLTTYLTRFVEV